MTKELVVHVKTIEQWKSVLNVWFEKGYEWGSGHKNKYFDEYFKTDGDRYLFIFDGDIQAANSKSDNETIEYKDFISQQEKAMTKETYYVTQEQLELIEKLKSCLYPLHILVMDDGYKVMNFSFSEKEEKSLLRYLGGDTSIEFKVKEQVYRLWRIDDGDRVYMVLGHGGTPIYTEIEDRAFTAPLDEIKKHKTVSWEIEEVK